MGNSQPGAMTSILNHSTDACKEVISKYSKLKGKPAPIFNGPFIALLDFISWQVHFKAHSVDWASMIISMLLAHILN
jgi:hypothetical protein